MSDTIFAQATPPGRAGLAVVRISGPSAVAAVARMTDLPLSPRTATLRRLRDPETGEPLDEAVLLHFPAPGSFTGETVVEIQCHGSPAVTRRLLHVLGRTTGLRVANPGEFTRRALENGRLDLAQVEGLADLLAAETEAQRRQAFVVASGELSATIQRWRSELMDVLALLEAVIDFGDDGVPDDVLTPVPDQLRAVMAAMDAVLAGSGAAERIRDGFTVAICGEPNVGKSTLLNALAGREVALTSEIAGTTRDVLEVHLELRGLPVTILDTAGLRETDECVELLGIQRARVRIDAADLRVFLKLDQLPDAFEKHFQVGDLFVEAKSDLRQVTGPAISGVSGDGLEDLLNKIAMRLEERAAGSSGLAQERQKAATSSARSGVDSALQFLTPSEEALELASFELRSSIRALDSFTGQVDVEAILDRIFRSFCLGK